MTRSSTITICRRAELASSKELLMLAFKRFNKFLRYFLVATPDADNVWGALGAISTLPMSGRFESILKSAVSMQGAAKSYKEAFCRGLTLELRHEVENERVEDS